MKASKQNVLTIALLFLTAFAGATWGQRSLENVSPEEAERLLLRLERLKNGDFSCLILHQDKTFHLEIPEGDRVDVREGVLSEAAAAALANLLADQGLAALSQEKIQEPLVSQERHSELAVNIHRTPGPDGWQNLHFRTAESQVAFKAETSLVHKWFDFLGKEHHKSLTEEEGRNNCRLGKIALKERPRNEAFIPFPKNGPGGEGVPFLLRVVINQTFGRNFGNGMAFDDRVERTCVLVDPRGRYHLEENIARVGESEQRKIFDDALTEAELAGLRQLLDEPGLATSTHRNRLPDVPVHEVDFTTVLIARRDGIQNLSFGSFSVSHGYRTPEKPDTEKDTAVIQSVRNWIKKDLEKRGVPANPQGITNGCEVPR